MHQDGRYYIKEMVATMKELEEELPRLSPPLPADVSQQAVERLQKLAEMLASIQKKLFVKTQGGTEIAKECAEQVAALKESVAGLSGKPREEATAQLEGALNSAEEKIEPFVEKTRSLVIRMT